MRDAVTRADGRLRKTLFASLGASSGLSSRQIVESSPTPLAVVNGGAEPIVNLDYFDSIRDNSTLCLSAFSRLSKATALPAPASTSIRGDQ